MNDTTPVADSSHEEMSSLVLKHYSTLNETGILRFLEQREEENGNLRKVISAGKRIASQQGILMILEATAAALNDRFIPSTLTFLIESDRGCDAPDIVYYRNLKRSDAPFSVPSLAPYRFFFDLTPETFSFPVFEYMIGKPELTDLFKTCRPAIVMPLVGFEQVYGFILIGEKIMGMEYTSQEISFLQDVMQFTSIGLQNNIHYLKAIKDLKTHLYNNAYIRSHLETELARVRRYNFELAVIITDVDHFKNFNDTYGHMSGDKMLMRIAEVFMESIRQGDVAGRFGGEEFVLLLIQCSRENALLAAERIREKVEKIVIEEEGRFLRSTISLGIRHVTRDTHDTADSIIAQADKALYEAKHSGRNRTCVFDPPCSSPDEGEPGKA